MENIIIRKAKMEDIRAVSILQAESHKTAYKGILDEEYLESINFENIIEKRKKDFNKFGFVVAEFNNEIVGFSRYDFEEKEADVDCELRALYVKSNLKRNGIGRKLMEYVMDDFRNQKKKKMILWCLKDNYSSRAFYKAMRGIEYKTKSAKFGTKEYDIISYIYDL